MAEQHFDAFGQVRQSWAVKDKGWGWTETSFPQPGEAVTETAIGGGDTTRRRLSTDGFGRLALVQEGDTLAEPVIASYAHDVMGRLTSFENSAGDSYKYVWDGAGRKRQVSRGQGAAQVVVAQVNYAGPDPISYVDPTVSAVPSMTWADDHLGRTTSKTTRDALQPSGTGTYTWRWDKNAAGQVVWNGVRTQITDPYGALEYGYNGQSAGWGAVGHLTSVNRSWAPALAMAAWSESMNYDSDGRLEEHGYNTLKVNIQQRYSAGGFLQYVDVSAPNAAGLAEVSQISVETQDEFGMPTQWSTL